MHTGITGVTSIEQRSGGLWLRGLATRAVEFDAVIMSTGWPADVGSLGLDLAGVEVLRSSIPADDTFRAAVPTIFAVGDANGRDMLVQAAVFEGEAAAENAVLDASLAARRTTTSPRAGSPIPTTRVVRLTEEQASASGTRNAGS